MGEGNFIGLATTYSAKKKGKKICVDRVYKQSNFPRKAKKLFGLEVK